jgi:hypothetical protein
MPCIQHATDVVLYGARSGILLRCDTSPHMRQASSQVRGQRAVPAGRTHLLASYLRNVGICAQFTMVTQLIVDKWCRAVAASGVSADLATCEIIITVLPAPALHLRHSFP